MSYQKERDQFISEMSKRGYSYDECRALLRIASGCETYNYRLSCIEMSGQEAEKQARKDERREQRAREILERHGHTLVTSGDPRGYALRVGGLGIYNTWGGEDSGYGIPTRQI